MTSPATKRLIEAAREHELKIWPQYFQAILDGRKAFEIRKNDRGFFEGDILWLREFDPSTGLYSGREMKKRVSYILLGPAWGLPEDMAILSIQAVEAEEQSPAEKRIKELEGLFSVQLDMIQRIEELEAENKWLREALEKCKAQRNTYHDIADCEGLTARSVEELDAEIDAILEGK